ncbi:MAG: DUF309 domain-containing protein [Candidatus Melainabacteria bacterium]|nr:DUF309 domain-containing protein [Candidatus Melainabacteria bacterium]
MESDNRFIDGLRLFNDGKYHESHDVLEDLWSETRGEYRELYQGIIKIAVALYLVKESRLTGAYKLYKGSIGLLEKYKSNKLMINVEKFIEDIKTYFVPLEYWDGKSDVQFDNDLLPKIE